jgi:hypothetical protein
MIIEHNCETGKITEREPNAAELAQNELDKLEADARQIEIEAKVQAKAALLERLGITADEAKLLLA